MTRQQADVIVAGHICLDIIPEIENKGHQDLKDIFVPGRLMEIGPSLMTTGGAVSNTGIALHRLGFSSRLMGKVGDDQFGNAILDVLSENGQEIVENMIVAEGEDSSYSLVISPPGIDRMFLHCSGTNNTFASSDIPYEQIQKARLFHFGYPPLMKKIYENDGIEMVEIFQRIKQMGITTSLDMAYPDPDSEPGRVNWQKFLENVLPYVDIFLPSYEEILFMVDNEMYNKLKNEGKDIESSVSLDVLNKISSKLIQMGVAVVVIKLGDNGLYVRTTNDSKRLEKMGKAVPKKHESWLNRELLAPCFEVNVAGATGAGDCTIAGFLASLLNNLDLEDALKTASGVGAFNVEKVDATSGIPSWEVVQKRIKDGWSTKEINIPLENWKQLNGSPLWMSPQDKF